MIEPVGGHGGMNYYDCGLISGLRQNGVESFWYTNPQGATCEAARKIVRSFRGIYSSRPKWLRAIVLVGALFFSLLHAKANKCSIVHYHFFGNGIVELLFVILARLFGFKLVVTAHDIESLSGAREQRFLNPYRLAHRIICHNDVSRRAFIKKFVDIDVEKICVVPHGNYLPWVGSLPSQSKARADLRIPNTVKVILFFGQIKKVKGLDILIKAFHRLHSKHPDSHLVIAGKIWKDDFERYEQLINSSGIDQAVTKHIRYIHDDDVGKYYAAANVIALPYRQIYQSGVLLMAMSYGKAVVASDLPAMKECINDGFDGVLFECGNEKKLEEALEEVLYTTGLARRIGNNGIESMEKYFDWGRIGRLTKSVYWGN